MRRSFYAAVFYLASGLIAGLFYREFTKAHDFPSGQVSQLGLAHTHLLTLGFVVMLLVLLLDNAFGLSPSKLFSWFFWVYNAGVVVTSAMLITHGSLTVLGRESSPAIAGIAGLGHILITIGLTVFCVALGRALPDRGGARRAGAQTASTTGSTTGA